jgi:hypothetical protein
MAEDFLIFLHVRGTLNTRRVEKRSDIWNGGLNLQPTKTALVPHAHVKDISALHETFSV